MSVIMYCFFFFFFFFKQKTAYEITTGDWSSDVCSSDLAQPEPALEVRCSLRPTRPARAGERRRRRAEARRDVRARRAVPAARARRGALLPRPAAPHPPRAAPLAPGCRPRPGGARDLARPTRPVALRRQRAGDPRRPRRLAFLYAVVRLSCAQAAQPDRRPHRRLRAAKGR